MKSIFKATAILSGSSIASIFLSLVSAKVMAIYLQPAGYGYYGLLQSFVGFTTLLAGMGMATGLVRLGAGAASQGESAAVAELRSGAWILFGSLAAVILALLVIFRHALSQWALGTPDHPITIVLTGLAILFTAASNVQMGTLNAYHLVTALAKYGVLNTVVGALVTITSILAWGVKGVVPGIIGSAVVAWLVSGYYVRKSVGPIEPRPNRTQSIRAAWSLLRFGGPFTASALVGTGVQLILPMIVLHMLSTESVGYYRAAAAISVGYLGFLVTAMGQDYYPRVSAAASQPELLAKLINEQHRLIMLLVVPMIIGTLAIVPYMVPLVYSLKFGPTVEILEWQLIGDLFKFSSWTMGFAILARCKTWVYLVVESIGGFFTLLSTWICVRWFGLTGLGISFLATYIAYYLVVWIVIRREVPFSFTTRNKQLMLIGVVAAFAVRMLPATHYAQYRTPFALMVAFAIGIPSLFVIWREFMAGKQQDPTSTFLPHPSGTATTS